jgi:hypothetical protein
MLKIAELSVLSRAQIKLPVRLKLATEEFREGWRFVRSGGANQLEKRIQRQGWHFIRIADGVLQSGVGESSQQAIACALKLALRSISEYFNAVEVRRIHLTMYPWFVLAKVGVYPLRIQQSAVHVVPDSAFPFPPRARNRQLPVSRPWLSARYGSAIPMLKEMLISPGRAHERTQ